MNLDFGKVCGKHISIFEAYYKQIDPKGSGAIEAMTAAKFLKKSGLSDVVLSRIWDLSDPNGKGFLDKPGFFVALKLVSLAQAGQVINMSNIYMETANPPKVGDLPKIMPQRIQTVPPASGGGGGVPTGDWSIGVIERLKYEQLFESLKPINNMLPGNKVKGVLMDSKLPTDTLGKIWDLADQDKDGNLDKHEFIVAMHLVAQTLEKRIVPDILPMELRKPGAGAMPPKPAPPNVAVAGGVGMPRAPSGEGFADSGGFVANFPKDIAPPPVVPPPPMLARLPPVGGTGTTPPLIMGNTDAPLIPIGGPPSAADWVVTPADQKRYEIMFRQSDMDKDGLVSGLEVKNIFLQSGVPQNCLAHIWALADTNQSGKLTLEQFALAMWLVERKQKGIEPPQVLMANMVPPSMRSIVPGVDMQPQAEPRPTYSNPELEMISKEIEELAKERRALELEIAQKESDIHIKKGEVRSLQGELDTLLATLKQLENQRGEAQKRLDDLKAQSTDKQMGIENMNLNISLVRNEVNKIREQCQKQEETINEQEGELNAKRSELQKLKDEESSLQKEYDENNRELQKLTNHLQNTQLQISSVRSMVTQLLEVQRQMTDALLMCRAAIENQDGELVSEYQLKIEPDFDEAKKQIEKKIEMQETKVDPFDEEEKKDAMKSTTNGFAANGFESDPFTAGAGTTTTTTIRGGFDDSFNASSGFDSANFDAFGSGSSSGFGMPQKDPFGGDTFGAGATKSSAITPEPGKDDFGSDPFAALHAPTGQGQVLSPNAQKSGPPPRPESPSPALPPKKSKVPPPRPAPPRPLQGPPRPAQPDAFGSSSTGSGGFADFADFDNKPFESLFLPSTTTSTALMSTTPSNNAFNDFFKNTDNISTATTNNTKPTTTSTQPTTTSIINFNTDLSSSSSNLALLASLAQGSGSNGDGGFGGMSSSGGPPTGFESSTTIFHNKQKVSISTNSSTTTTTTTINSTTTTTTNNHLTRSITPSMQQTANTTTNATVFDAFDNTKATIAKLTTATTTKTSTSATTTTKKSVSGPTDFSDDPFKDYRYEDPFSIKDPFDDDEDVAAAVVNDPSKLFKDVFEDDNKDVEQKLSGNKNEQPQQFGLPKTVTPALSDEFVNQFDAFGLNPSPVLSHKSTTSTTKKSQEKLFDNFADFDAFSTKSASPTFATAADKNANTTTTTIKTTTSKNDSFFDAFNDNFSTNDSNTKASLFDAFGDADKNKNKANFAAAFAMTTTKTPAAGFNDNSLTTTKKISNNFEDDFDAFGNAITTKKTTFDKFDAFGDCVDFPADFSSSASSTLNNSATLGSTKSALSSLSTTSSFSSLQKPTLKKVQNETTINKKSNWQAMPAASATIVTDGVKLPEKFAADYSKPEHFDDDIEEAIKRSMIDQ